MAEASGHSKKQKLMVYRLMETVFSGVELERFCQEQFPEACDRFTAATDNATKIQTLIDYCDQRGQLGQLVARVQKAKPEAYQTFVQRTREDSPGTAPLASSRPAGSSIASTFGQMDLPQSPEGLVRHLLAGRYRIDQMLDKGGVGAVFKAFDTKLEIDVAIKIIDLNRVQQPAMRERVQQEVQTAMRLDHPGVVQFYDFGQDGSLIYVLMEFISGYNLREAQRRFKALEKRTFLPPVVQLMQQICLTVDYMHQQGVLHPSTKPDNIMLKPGRSAGEQTWQPVFVNLGLLRPHRDSLKADEEIPVDQLIYAVSPELLLGHTTDIRSDVYMLGLVLYELVVGQPPFVPGDLTEAVRLHVEETPPAPRSVDPTISERLEQVILKALAKDPADRYLSARGMAQALAGALSGSTSTALAPHSEIVLVSDTRHLVVTPGDSLNLPLTLRNLGDLEEQVQVKVQGVPPEWVSISPLLSILAPGEDRLVEVAIQPPRTALSRAGRHAITIQVASQRDPKQIDEMRQVLTVAPFVEFASDLWPRELSSGQITQVAVENYGNVTENFTIQARPEDSLNFEPDRTQIKLGAGDSGAVDMRVSYRRWRWIGENRTQTFSILVGTPQSPAMIHTAEVTSRTVLSTRWALAAALLVLLFLCAVAAFYPIINPSPQSIALTAGVMTSQAVSRQATLQAATAQIFIDQTATVLAAATQTAQVQVDAGQAATATALWAVGDDDRDGLTNGEEQAAGTRLDVRDTDGDGLDDGAEVTQFNTSPLNPDTDYDGILDGEEIRRGLSPLLRDTDGDNTPDATDIDPGRVPTPTATVTPNPTATRVPVVRFANAAFIVDEREAAAVVTVILDASVSGQVTVDYATTGGTAEAGGDYRTSVGTLIINPGQTSQRFTVPIVNDTLDEPDEFLNLNLSNPQGATLGGASQATITILDDDEPISIRFGQGSRLLGVLPAGPLPLYQVDENQNRAIIDVVLSAPANQQIRVDYTTNDSEAVAGQDYGLARGTLFFDPGVDRRIFEVSIVNDANVEPDESLILTLSNPVGARIDTPRAELVIVDDD